MGVEFGLLSLRFNDCSRIRVENAVQKSTVLMQQLGGLFVYGNGPEPRPWERVNREGNLMGIQVFHPALSVFEKHGVSFGVISPDRSVGFSGDISFVDLRKVDEAANESLQFAELLYPHLQPAYGWLDEVGTNSPESDDAVKRKLTHICWANFFGPPYVEKLGRDFLLKAPGWRVQELSDGGILYVLSPSFVNRWQVVKAREVRSYFQGRIPDIKIYRASAYDFRQ